MIPHMGNELAPDLTELSSGRKRWNHALWLGPLLTFAGMISYFQFFARFPSLRDFPWINLPLVLIGLGLSGLGWWRAFSQRSRLWVKIAGSIGMAFSLLVGGFFVAYVFAISYTLPAVTAKSLETAVAPDFGLSDHAGKLVRLSDYRGSKVVIVFYRGHW
jgi:hypothetical protein